MASYTAPAPTQPATPARQVRPCRRRPGGTPAAPHERAASTTQPCGHPLRVALRQPGFSIVWSNTMSLVSMRQLLDHAAEHGYGIPAFNVNNLEQVQAIMAAADALNSPVIMQASAGARKYAGEAFLRHLIDATSKPIRTSRSSCTRTTASR